MGKHILPSAMIRVPAQGCRAEDSADLRRRAE